MTATVHPALHTMDLGALQPHPDHQISLDDMNSVHASPPANAVCSFWKGGCWRCRIDLLPINMHCNRVLGLSRTLVVCCRL